MKRFANIPVQVKAGTHDVAVTFIERARVESDEFVGVLPGDEFSRGDREPRLAGRRAGGRPVQLARACRTPPAAGGSSSAARRRTDLGEPSQERACARRIAANLARRAFRRPVTDADIDSLMPYLRARTAVRARRAEAARRGGFDAGIEQLVAAVLVSPDFLYRAIRTPAGGGCRRLPLTDLELASRLSFFLWSQGPDETLLDAAGGRQAADAGGAAGAGAADAQGPRARRAWCATSRSSGWTSTTSPTVEPDPNLFPTFNDAAAAGPGDRDRVVRRRACCSRIAASATCSPPTTRSSTSGWRGTTASPRCCGPQFRRVTLADARRWGVLGKGAVLLRTSYGDRTSPVLRGAWVHGQADGHAADAAAARRRHGSVDAPRARRRRRCGRGSRAIARSRAATSATA